MVDAVKIDMRFFIEKNQRLFSMSFYKCQCFHGLGGKSIGGHFRSADFHLSPTLPSNIFLTTPYKSMKAIEIVLNNYRLSCSIYACV